jgi:adenosylcobinamide-GDP ribazoletransferase
MRSFLIAVSYLTIVPISLSKAPSDRAVARSRYWYPVVGLLMGAALGGLTALAGLWNAPAAGAALIVAAWVALTGAFHLDGCCDLCDGLFGARSAEQRLAVMKDPHLGTFGLVGGVLVVLGKFAAMQTLLTQSPTWAALMIVIVAAMVVARCLVLWVAGGATYPRDQGTGKAFIEGTSRRDGWIAALVALLVVALAAATGMPDAMRILIETLVLFAPVFLSAVLIRRACDRRLGGVTGDCLGATIEVTEVVFLLSATVPL